MTKQVAKQTQSGQGSSQGSHLGDTASARPPADAPLKLEDFLPYQLNVAASLVSQALSRIYAQGYGIGVPEWRVLVTLGQFGVMSGKAVGAHSHMHKTKVSRAVANLEQRKLLLRRSNKSDLREQLLSLTPEGRAIYEHLAPGAQEFAKHLLEAIAPADRPAFSRALADLTQHAKTLTDMALTDMTLTNTMLAEAAPTDTAHIDTTLADTTLADASLAETDEQDA